MRIDFYIFLITLFISSSFMAQNEELPYYKIPEVSDSYAEGAIMSRMIDGLGFRYFWATEGLRVDDLQYKPSDLSRTSEETIKHIYDLSNFILASVLKDYASVDASNFSFLQIRKQTLLNFKKASDILKVSNDLSQFDNSRYPFWNVINGPIADALWHCGQIVLLRRASGNPFNSKVSVFWGKLRD